MYVEAIAETIVSGVPEGCNQYLCP
jgi:hypothetical protein